MERLKQLFFRPALPTLVSVSWSASAAMYDNFSMIMLPKIVQTSGVSSGSLFTVGTTINTFVATDAAANTANCSFTYTVTDMSRPLLRSLQIKLFSPLQIVPIMRQYPIAEM